MANKTNPTEGRFVTPHKGGRTERAYIRLTPADKAALAAIKAATGKTAADLLSEIIAQYADALR